MEKPIPYQAAKEAELEEDAEGACDFETRLSVVLLLEVGGNPWFLSQVCLKKGGRNLVPRYMIQDEYMIELA